MKPCLEAEESIIAAERGTVSSGYAKTEYVRSTVKRWERTRDGIRGDRHEGPKPKYAQMAGIGIRTVPAKPKAKD